MKVEDNHYMYRIETKDSNGSIIDFVDIDTVEPLRCAYDVQDELNLETNEHIKRVEEIILNADSTEFWYVDEDRSTDTHLVCYFEEVQLMANADHPMVDTDRSLFEYGKINANEYQDTNFICTHVMPNGVSRIYMSIDKDQLLYQTYTNETIKEYIAQNPITVWYAIRYPVAIPRSMSKGHLLTLDGQTDVSISTNGKEVGLPLVKFNIGETEYNVDNKTLSIKNTTEGAQIRNIVLEGNTPINYARGNGVNTTEATSDTRYDFDPFYDGQTTIQGTVEGGYVSAKLYGDTMVNIAKPYGETPLLTATSESTLCDDLLGMNEEDVALADGELTEGRIYGDSVKVDANAEFVNGFTPNKSLNNSNGTLGSGVDCVNETYYEAKPFIFKGNVTYKKVLFYDIDKNRVSVRETPNTSDLVISTIPTNAKYMRFSYYSSSVIDVELCNSDGSLMFPPQIQSVVNPSVEFINANQDGLNLFDKNAYTPNVVNTNTGEVPEGTNIGYWTSDFIPVFSTNTYTWIPNRGDASEICFYDANKNFVEGKRDRGATYIPPQDGYVRFVFPKGVLDTLQFGILDTLDVDNYKPYVTSPSKFTSTHTLNKLPNGVADYIDVVNKVHVQRVGRVVFDGAETGTWIKGAMNANNSQKDVLTRFYYNVNGYNGLKTSSSMLSDKLPYSNVAMDRSEVESIGHMGNAYFNFVVKKDRLSSDDANGFKTWLQSNPTTIYYELATPIYTPLTDEEIAQLPLSAYKDGYVMLSSDQLTPSFEFRMRASNRYQVDMLETGYYYLNAPVGNVKLGTANVDVQQMPCIIKVDNVGTGDSGYRLGFDGGESIHVVNPTGTYGYWVDDQTGELKDASAPEKQFLSDFIEIDTNISSIVLVDDGSNKDVSFWDENKAFVKRSAIHNNRGVFKATIPNQPFKFIRIGSFDASDLKARAIINPITLAKLPSHRIPTTFTQGMKYGTDFGYWEGVKESAWRGIRLSGESGDGSLRSADNGVRYLNRLEGNYQGVVIVEDEFDFAIGKLTKRIGKVILDGSVPIYDTKSIGEEYTYMTIFGDKLGIKCKNSFSNGSYGFAMSSTVPFKVDYGGEFNHMFVGGNNLIIIIKNNELGVPTKEGIAKYFESNPMTVYYELAVPEISYVDVLSHHGKTVNNATALRTNYYLATTYLQPQIKPSHLTYPVPSLVGNRTYTVVHNRKNINGSTKPIELNLGGTVVQLNDASSKTLVKTPSTLAHSNLIFIGGESTVDHIMVLDGDWTNKPIEYFENMKGHDTDAIITIIGNGQINDVAEQYLW